MADVYIDFEDTGRLATNRTDRREVGVMLMYLRTLVDSEGINTVLSKQRNINTERSTGTHTALPTLKFSKTDANPKPVSMVGSKEKRAFTFVVPASRNGCICYLKGSIKVTRTVLSDPTERKITARRNV